MVIGFLSELVASTSAMGETTVNVTGPVHLKKLSHASNQPKAEELELPKNIKLVISGDGKIHLNGGKLNILGCFEAAVVPVFEFEKKHSFEGEEYVVFGPNSVERVVATWFGAVSNTESTDAVQRAIEAANLVAKVYLPRGNYIISDTIHMGGGMRDEGKKFFYSPARSLTLEGDGYIGSGRTKTTLKFEQKQKDRPLINIQSAAGIILRDLSLVGGNEKSYQEGRNKKRPKIEHWVDSETMIGAYKPYCAIATDAYIVGAEIHKNYSDELKRKVEFYPEGKIYYTTKEGTLRGTGSQDILIERVSIYKFGVGVAIAPAAAPQNDDVVIDQCDIDSCTFGIAIGSTQARGVNISNTSIFRAFSAITTIDFATGQGSLVNCNSNQYKDCRMLYRFNGVNGGPCSIAGDYCENVIRLGTFGLITSTSHSSSVSFSGCNYRFVNEERINHGTLGVIVNNSMLLNFQGCFFSSPGVERNELNKDQSSESSDSISEIHLLPITEHSKFVFDSCSFRFPKHERISASGKQEIYSEIPIRPILHQNPYAFNWVKNSVTFRSCSAWFSDKTGAAKVTTHVLSDNLVIYLKGEKARRVPIHWSTKSITASGGIYGEQQFSLKNTLLGDGDRI